MKTPSLLALIVSTCLFASPVSASIQVYTDRAAFLAALDSYYLETFDGVPTNSFPSGEIFSGPDYGFEASTIIVDQSSSDLFGTTIAEPDRALSVRSGTATLRIGELSGLTSVTALGGYFFVDAGGSPASIQENGAMSITATNGVDTKTHNFSTPTFTTFVGFISDGPAFTELTMVRTSEPIGFVATNDFIVGTAATTDGAIPEPGSLLVWGGLALAVLLSGRRRPMASAATAL